METQMASKANDYASELVHTMANFIVMKHSLVLFSNSYQNTKTSRLFGNYRDSYTIYIHSTIQTKLTYIEQQKTEQEIQYC